MWTITEDQLMNRLSSSSKRSLRRFRKQLQQDRDNRNFDYRLADELRRYINSSFGLEDTLSYLKDLTSSKDGKLFSQGVRNHVEIFNAIRKFQEPNHPSFQWNRNYKRAKSDLISVFSKMRLQPLHYHDDESMVRALPKENTHSGFTFILTGRKKKGDNLEGIFKRYSEEERLARENGTFNKPILPGTRTQGSGAFTEKGEKTFDCKHKTRLVSMIDMIQIFAELKYALPLQKAIADWDYYAGGKDPNSISRIISNMRYKYGYYVSLDYSSYDQSVSDWLIWDAFDIVKSAFKEVDEELFNILVEDFIHKNFILWDGVYHADKGVPSGSMWTQIIDSIVNILMITTYLHSIDMDGRMIVMGDDNLLYTAVQLDLSLIATYIQKNFGVSVNSDKSSEGIRRDDPEFLSRFWRSDGQYRDPYVVVSKMLYPERFRDYKSGRVSPEMILYSYILNYNATMYRIMDVNRFLMDNPHLNRDIVLDRVDSRYLPGGLAFIKDYTVTHYAA